MLYEYIGVVKKILAPKTVGKVKQFTKRDIIVGNDINDNSKYENHICFSFMRDKVGLLDDVRCGSRVKVVFAVNGRVWNGPKGEQYFNELSGIGIYPVAYETAKSSQSQESVNRNVVDTDNDDIPF